jgi:hypothetical protein
MLMLGLQSQLYGVRRITTLCIGAIIYDMMARSRKSKNFATGSTKNASYFTRRVPRRRKERAMSRTRYKFKGYTITNCGYHQPDHCVWWEAVDENGEACFHGHSLREVEFMILDDEWEKKLREKDAEIERLKHWSVGNAATMREALESARNWCLNRLGNASYQVTVEGLLSTINAAISAPARNCDVGTAEEGAGK